MRLALGVIAGIVVAFACVFGVESIGHSLYPLPAGFDLTNPRDVDRLMAVMPTAALAFVVVAWFVGALAGAFTANLIARRALAGWIVAMLVIAAAVATMVMIAHPAWMWAAGLLLPLAAALLAARLVRARA
ncbi:MAG: hypothetical protein AB7H79_06785 [Sphingomonas sp.]